MKFPHTNTIPLRSMVKSCHHLPSYSKLLTLLYLPTASVPSSPSSLSPSSPSPSPPPHSPSTTPPLPT